MDLTGVGAVVVGGGSGIGRGISLGLGRAGARVMVADIDGDAATAVAGEVTGAGGTAAATTVDGTDRDSLGALAARAREQWGEVRVLSSNVGVLVAGRLDEMTEAE